MRLIKNENVRSFVDESGDTLVTLIGARKRDLDQRAQIVLDMAKVDFSNAEEPKIEDIKVDQAKINEFMFSAVAQKLIVGGEEITGDALLEAYRSMDEESGKWVDECIKAVWGEDKRTEKN